MSPTSGVPAEGRSGRRPLVKRYAGVVRLAHWLNAVFLVGMIASGLQIYNAYAHFGLRDHPLALPNPLDGQSHPPVGAARRVAGRRTQLALRARLAVRHHRTGLSRLPRVLGRVAVAAVSAPRHRPAVQMQLYYLRLRKEHPPQGKHNALQKAAYTFIVVLGALATLTGFAIYKPVQLAWLTTPVRRLRAHPLLALPDRLALRRLYAASRRAGVPGGSRVAPGNDHRLVSGEVSQP